MIGPRYRWVYAGILAALPGNPTRRQALSTPLNSLQLIERLVGFPTVSRNSNMDLIGFVQEYLAGFGIDSHLVPNAEGTKANLYATVGPAVAGGVVLSGHTDVVPVDGQAWDSDPFVIREADGKLYGRGTCDMKGFIAVGLALVPEMVARGLRRPIHFALSYDEEIGCMGAPDMITEMAKELPPSRAVIVGEPTSMKVVNAHKGMFGMETVVTGYEAHSSQTHRGVSAVMNAARLISFIDEMARDAAANRRTTAGFQPPHTSLHVGTVRGGTAMNIISRECRFEWDMRNTPEDDPQDYIDRFEAKCTELREQMRAVSAQADIVTTYGYHAPGLKPEPGGAAEELARVLTGSNDTEVVAYCTEAGQFQEEGFSAIICGPGSIDQAHQPNEFVPLDQVAQCEQVLRRLVDYQAN
ncbi:MAG: acetylornithine deacetylase [Gammaproteobacteria bacterium]|jgi:acetylornithine deacetylase